MTFNSAARNNMSTNAVISNSLAAVNKARQANVEAQAMALITSITNCQKSIKSYEDAIKVAQGELVKVADDVVTQASVLGTEFTPPLNPNQATIAEAIKKTNDVRQESVKLTGQKFINEITRNQATITNINKQIAEYRKQLNELSVDVVTETQVVG